MGAMGCGEPTFETCDDGGCRAEWVQQHWEESPEEVSRLIGTVELPVERLALVLMLTEKWPGTTSGLCELLENLDEKRRCQSLNQRPHLGIDVTQDDQKLRKEWTKFFGPSHTETVLSPWVELQAREVDCRDDQSELGCHAQKAKARAKVKDYEGAAAICKSVKNTKWRNECFFETAESLFQTSKKSGIRVSNVAPAIDLCLGSEVFAARCLTHLQVRLSRLVPRSYEDSSWGKLERLINMADTGIRRHNARLANRFVERVLAEVMWKYLSKSETLYVQPLIERFGQSGPFVRAAIANRLIKGSDLSQRSLGEWADLVNQTMNASSPEELERVPVVSAAFGTNETTWGKSFGKEAELPWTFMADGTRRVISADPEVDAAICVLEAVVKEKKSMPGLRFLGSGLDHPNEWVRWTAARHLQTWDQKKKFQAKIEKDESGLVRGRRLPEKSQQKKVSRRTGREPTLVSGDDAAPEQ